MRVFAAAALVFLVGGGCEYSGWEGVPGASVRPESRVASRSTEAWAGEVGGAIDAWAALLEPIGCPRPFVLSDATIGDHVVRLIDNADWPWPGDDGVTFNDAPTQPAGWMEIRTGPADPDTAIRWRRPLLMHELGHAFGLGHTDPSTGPSIMSPILTTDQVTPDDLAAAACSIGCGPCGTTVDPYDG